MRESDVKGYEYTGQVIHSDDVMTKHETAKEGVYWIQTEVDAFLATRHPDTEELWLELYKDDLIHDLDVDIVKVPKERVAKRMLLPGEYLMMENYAYVLNKRTRTPGKENETVGSDGENSLDQMPSMESGIYETILDYYVTNTVANTIKLMKHSAYMAYKFLHILRERHGSEWKDRHQKELKRMSYLSNGFHTAEEAGLLAIRLAEKALDALEGDNNE